MNSYYLVATREYLSKRLLKKIIAYISKPSKYSFCGFVFMNGCSRCFYIIFETTNSNISIDVKNKKLFCDRKMLYENELLSFCFPNKVFTSYDDYKKSGEYKKVKKMFRKERIEKTFKVISYLIAYPIAFIGVLLVSIASFINTGDFNFGDIYEEIFE
jgi:hypothetical protein